MWILFLFLSFYSFAFPKIPNAEITYGDLCNLSNTDFVEYRYPEKIPYCKRNVSSYRKSKIYDLYKIPVSERKNFTIDHLIPLSIGGSNKDSNLWAEHLSLKEQRGSLELDLFILLKSGTITQKQAINRILCSKFNNCYLVEEL
jgi:hypothetical protein